MQSVAWALALLAYGLGLRSAWVSWRRRGGIASLAIGSLAAAGAAAWGLTHVKPLILLAIGAPVGLVILAIYARTAIGQRYGALLESGLTLAGIAAAAALWVRFAII